MLRRTPPECRRRDSPDGYRYCILHGLLSTRLNITQSRIFALLRRQQTNASKRGSADMRAHAHTQVCGLSAQAHTWTFAHVLSARLKVPPPAMQSSHALPASAVVVAAEAASTQPDKIASLLRSGMLSVGQLCKSRGCALPSAGEHGRIHPTGEEARMQHSESTGQDRSATEHRAFKRCRVAKPRAALTCDRVQLDSIARIDFAHDATKRILGA